MEFAARAERSVMKDPGLLQELLAFALVPDMAEVTPPPIDRFELTNGHLLNARVAPDDIECFYRSFGRHSESDLPRQGYETDEDYEDRRQHRFRNRQNKAIDSAIEQLQKQ
ncbi:hypothetical protein ACKVWM_003470 [Pyricularia oryzae]